MQYSYYIVLHKYVPPIIIFIVARNTATEYLDNLIQTFAPDRIIARIKTVLSGCKAGGGISTKLQATKRKGKRKWKISWILLLLFTMGDGDHPIGIS